jgi:DNA topoisomerase-2
MHLFDKDQRLKKYNSIYNIIEEYYPVRYECYEKRKEFMITNLKKIVKVLSNKARFIKEQCDDLLDLRRKKKDIVIELLKTRGYDTIDDDDEYQYLRKMPIDSVIEENIDKLLKEKEEKEKELEIIIKTSIEDMWLKELSELKKEYKKYQNDRKVRSVGGKKVKKKKFKLKKKL